MTAPTAASRPRGATPGRGALLVRNARLVPLDGPPAADADPPVDLRLADGLVVETGPGLASRGESELDAAGHWVIPGLWDQHVHFTQAARAARWFDLNNCASADAVLERVQAQLAREDAAAGRAGVPGPDGAAPEKPGAQPSARGGANGVLTGLGYRSNGWPVPASVAALDALTGDRPVVLISGDVHNGWLNTAAQRLVGVGPFEGAIFESEWFAIFDRLGEVPGFASGDEILRELMASIAARGVTGVVDVEFGDAHLVWPGRAERGLDGLRVRTGVYPHQLADVVASGVRTGDVLGGGGLVTMGPAKAITDGSLSTATAWCWQPYAGTVPDAAQPCGAPNFDAAELRELAATATRAGLKVAFHGIGDRACQAVLDAIESAGAHGTVEHAQLLRWADVPRFAALGVAASVQPAHLLDDRDAIDRSWPGRGDRCFAFRSLLDAGAELRFGSDAPVSPIEPWTAIAAAVHRSGDERPGWHPEQSLTPREALAASVDGNRLTAGGRADLVVLGADPLWQGQTPVETAAHLRAMPVLATVCAGRVTFAGNSPGVP